MPQLIEFEGTQHAFPDDFSPEDISSALSTIPKQASWWDTFKAIPATAAAGVGKSVGGILQAVGEADLQGAYAEERTGIPSPVDTEMAAARKQTPLAKVGAGIYASADIQEKAASPGELSYWKRAVLSGVSSAAQQIPTLALSLATKNVTPAIGGAVALTGGQSYGEKRAAGVEPEKALGHAAIDAAAEGLLEFLPTSFLINNASGPVLKLLFGTLVREVPTEVLTTAVQSANAKISDRPDMTWEEYTQDLLDTVGAVMVSAPLLGGAAGAMNRLSPTAEVKGEDNKSLTTPIKPPVPEKPLFDIPTTPLTPETAADVQTLIDSIDADLIDDKQVADAQATITKFEEARRAPVLPEAVAAWKVLDTKADLDASELGASAKETRNALTYTNPNTLPRMETPFLLGPEGAGVEGLTPAQVIPKPGVYVLGQESEDRSFEFLKAVRDDTESWRAKYMPNAIIVVSNEQLPFDSALGWHSYTNGAHLIVPAAVRNPSKGYEFFNRNKLASAFYNLTHEFGHALLEETFLGGLDPLVGNLLVEETFNGLASEQTLASLPEGQKELVQEYNEKKQRILDGIMTASQFQLEWAGPAKAARQNFLEGVDPSAPAMYLLQRIASDAITSAERREGQKRGKVFRFPEVARARLLQEYTNELMSFKEYFAEQTARHAYKTQWDQTSAVGKLFRQALDSLRAFFAEIKRDGIIAPGVAFTQWLEGLTKTEQVTNRTEQQQVAAKGKKTIAKAKQGAKPAKKKKVARVQHNVETDTDEVKLERGKDLIFNLMNEGKLGLESPDAKEMLKLLKQKDYDEFIDLYKKYSRKKVNFELKPPGGMWEPGTAEELARHIFEWNTTADKDSPGYIWAVKAIQNYLNKYAATEHDPLAPVEIPFRNGTKTWGSLWRGIVSARPAWLVAGHPGVTDYSEFPKGFDAWVEKVPPSEPIYGVMWNSMEKGVIDPRHGVYQEGAKPHFLPSGTFMAEAVGNKIAIQNYLRHLNDYIAEKNLTAQQLQKYDLVRLVKETVAWDKELAKNLQKARAQEKEISPIYKQYSDGMYWQQLTKPGQFIRESDAMGHSVRGYEPAQTNPDWTPAAGTKGRETYGIGGWGAIKRGEAKIYSLRDKTGNSHVTIEVHDVRPDQVEEGFKPDIMQIKGKQNLAPNDEYLPYVQDFVKSGSWNSIGNIENTGLFQLADGTILDQTEAIAKIKPYLQEHPFLQQGNQRAEDILRQLEEPAKWSSSRSLIYNLLQRIEQNTSPELRANFEIDATVDDQPEAEKLLKGIRNFISDPGPIRRALRRAQGMAFWALQMQQLAHLNPDLRDLQAFRYFNTKYNAFKNFLQSSSDALSKQWSDLSTDNFDKVNKIVLDHLAGGELWFDLIKTTKQVKGRETPWYEFQVNARTLDEFNKRGVDLTTPEGAELGKLVLDVQNDLLDKLNHLELVLQGVLAHRHGAVRERLVAEIQILKKRFQEIRKVPFFPQGRFGNYMVIIERHKATGGWEIVSREAFENKALWEEGHKKAEARKKPDERVQAKEMTDQQYVLLALPTDFIDLAASELDLTQEQVDVLLAILQPARAEKTLQPYDKAKMAIKGYSTDAMRSYANFNWHQANLIAKLEYRVKFNLAISNIKSKLREAQYAGPEAEKEAFRLQRVTTAMERSRDYIMSPPNEAQMLRGIVAVSYLALNIKTALINGVGLITTYSDMTERLGLLQGTTAMARAVKQTLQTTKLTDLNQRQPGEYLPPETQRALDQALTEGVLAQSYAYYLAGVANAGNLFRIPSHQLIRRVGKQSVDAAMWAFRLMELGTRRVSFLSQFEYLRNVKKLPFEDAYNGAVDRVNILQNEYSLGNRPAFMRGFKIEPGNPLAKVVEPIVPLATVFMSFTQHMSFHVYGGYELGLRREMKFRGETPRHRMGTYTLKLWVILLALAGYEGLPMAEDLLNWLDVAWRKWGGGKSLRESIREYINSIESVDLDPQLFAHGLGHDIGGFDVSRSMGLGRVVPGLGNLATPEETVAGTVGTLVLDMFGPAGALAKFGLEASFGKAPLSEAATRLPGAAGNIYTSAYWAHYGVRSPEKALITTDLETGELRELTATELIGKAAGFNPTIVSQAREIRSAQRELKIYWTARQQELLNDIWTAKWQKSKEGEADARKAVLDFNASIPTEYKSLRINNYQIAQMLLARRKAQMKAQQQKAPQKKFNAPYESVRDSFE